MGYIPIVQRITIRVNFLALIQEVIGFTLKFSAFYETI
jgi:hypothetical protein